MTSQKPSRPYHEPPSFRGHAPPSAADDPLSLVALVRNGTLDLDLATLLWLTIARRGSVIVAAGPRLAGKTTVLTALTDLLPSDTETVYTYGAAEDLAFLQETTPEKTFIVINEISDHLPIYLWGPTVGRVFESLEQGYALGATLHADTPEEVLGVLLSPALGTTPALVGNIHLIITLVIGTRGEETIRRVSAASLLLTPASAPPRVRVLAEWDPGTDSFRHPGGEGLDLLAEQLRLDRGSLDSEIAQRRAVLEDALAHEPSTRDSVRQRLRDWKGKQP